MRLRVGSASALMRSRIVVDRGAGAGGRPNHPNIRMKGRIDPFVCQGPPCSDAAGGSGLLSEQVEHSHPLDVFHRSGILKAREPPDDVSDAARLNTDAGEMGPLRVERF